MRAYSGSLICENVHFFFFNYKINSGCVFSFIIINIILVESTINIIQVDMIRVKNLWWV